MHNHFDVLIIGGGITGNASALTLSQCGFRVGLISSEKPAVTTEQFDARIYALSNTSVKLLKNLRVWDAVDANRICAVNDMRIMGDATHGEAQQGVLHFNAYKAHQSELAWIVEQQNIQNALIRAIQFSPNITVITDAAIELQVTANKVQIQTTNAQIFTADLIIGSDGAQSWVRQASKIGTDIFDYAQNGIVANFTCAQAHHGCAYQWFLPDGAVLALLPLPQQRVSMVYSCGPQTTDELLSLSAEELAQNISARSHQVLGELHADSNVRAQSFPLKRMRAHRFIGERTLLLGDAAHTVHPLAGQGLNLGLQDLACLRDLIMQRESFRTIYDSVLLRRYERARVAATAQMQGVTHVLNRTFTHNHPAIRHARNLGMNLLDIAPPLKRWLIKTAMGQGTQQS